MSVPANFRVGPHTSLVLVKKKYLILYIFEIWFSFFVIQFEFWWYWNFLYYYHFVHFLIFLPLLIFVIYVSLAFSSLLIAKFLLICANLLHKPREGTFLREIKDRDYRYWSVRNTIKRWPIWVAHKFPLPFLDNLCFKLFSVKTKFSNSLFEAWCDTEFIEFGKNVVCGQASIIQSSIIIGNLLIIRKTIIEDNVRIGVHSVVMPGTHIHKNAVLAASSLTTVGQELEEGWIYLGAPARKYKKDLFFEDGLEEIIANQKHDIEKMGELGRKYDELYTRRKDKTISKHLKNI
ncbi:MAG: DapH/DapD/GlmU-related protein [Promethearchaeota archaeon]